MFGKSRAADAVSNEQFGFYYTQAPQNSFVRLPEYQLMWVMLVHPSLVLWAVFFVSTLLHHCSDCQPLSRDCMALPAAVPSLSSAPPGLVLR